MAELRVPGGEHFFGGDHFLKNANGQRVVWLPIGVAQTFAFVGSDLAAHAGPADQRDVVSETPGTVAVSNIHKASDKITFTLTASASDVVKITCQSSAGTEVGALIAVSGNVENHPGMQFDLLADVMRGSNPVKTLAVQRLLLNDANNIFNQKNAANVKRHGGPMECGKVVNASGKDLFGTMSPIFYEYPYHEPLDQVNDRADVRYTPETIFLVRTAIKGLLAKGTPVRVGVLDSPVGMFVQDRQLIAYFTGGHTTLIVGCDKAASTFMYIDTWPGGSKLKYQGGIPGPGAPKDPCLYMGLFNAEYYFTRSLKKNSSAPNLLRQDRNTEGNFNTGRGNYLEIVSGCLLYTSDAADE